MGQKIGKASFEEDAKPFLNLPAPAINAVWTKFNLSAEAWGLRTPGFTNICKPLAPFMSLDEAIMDEKALALFKLLDTDMNDIVDALEFMATLAMVSAMEPADKVKFIYTVYDFSESGALLVDEITMAVKSTVEGLCKVSKLPPPAVAQFEDLAKLAFKGAGKDYAAGKKLTLSEFLTYADASPTTTSWVAHFDDIPDAAEAAPPVDKSYELPTYPARTEVEARLLEGLPVPPNPAGAWHKAPEAKGDELDAETGEPVMTPGTPSYEAVTGFLKPEERTKTIPTSPDSQLSLEWVYGVSTLCRGHVSYAADGSILYAAGAVGVQYRFPNEEAGEDAASQKLFLSHKDMLTALAVSPVPTAAGGSFVASADCSSDPKVMLWTAGKGASQLKSILQGFKAPVFALDFSPDGSKLLSVSKDAGFTVSVHDAASGLRLFNACANETVFGAKWCRSPRGSASGGSFALATAKGIVFYAESGLSYEARKGVAGSKAKAEALVSLQAMAGAETMAAGGQSGALYKYEGRNVSECVAAHKAPVTVLAFLEAALNTAGADGDRLFSGSMDATVKIWGANLEPVAVLDLVTLGDSLGREVLSLDVSKSTGGGKVLVATSGAEVWELTAVAPPAAEGEEEEAAAAAEEGGEDGEAAAPKNGPGQTLHPATGWLFNGHFGGGVGAIAASPTEPTFASGGADGTLRLYSSESHACTKVQQLSTAAPITCAAYAPDGSNIAVGVGGGVDVLDPSNLADRVARLPVDDDDAAIAKRSPVKMIRYSGDGGVVMVLDEAKVVTLYTAGSWSPKQSFDLSKATPAAVNGLDLSDDGAWLQVGTDNMELLYYSVETGEPAPEGHVTLKTAMVKVSGCGLSGSKIAYEKQFAYPPHCAPGDVNTSTVSAAAALCLAADRFGAVHLFNYPAASPTGYASWQAHTPSAKNPGAAFVAGDAHVVTAGAEDLTVLQWKLDVDEVLDEPKEPEPAEPEEIDEDNPPEKTLQDEEDGPTEDYKQGPELSDADKPPLFHALVNGDAAAARSLAAKQEAEAEAEAEAPEAAVEGEAAAAAAAAPAAADDDPFAASTPLFAGAVAPEEARAAAADPPADGLALDWVHGCSAQSMRGGVRYNSSGEVVYAAAALPVVFNKTEVTQRYVSGHSDSVTALAMHPGGVFVATGQKGASPCVIVADSLTGVVVGKFLGGPDDASAAYGAVSAVAFSSDGNLLAFTTQDEGSNTLFVYSWREAALKAKVASGPDKVMALAFSPDSSQLLSCGVDHFSLWAVSGRGVSKKRGIFGPGAIKQTLLSCCWIPPIGEEGTAVAVMGAADGSLYKLDGRTVGEVFEKVHDSAAAALYAYAPFEEDGHCLASGGADGVVKLFGAELGEAKLEINLRQAKYNVFKWAVKSVCLNKDGRKVLVGTAGSEIYEFSATEEAVDMNDGPLVTGHCRGKLPALAAHPIQPEYATAGDDRTLRLWSIEERKLSRMLVLGTEDCEATCVGYRPDGHLIAVGLKSGAVLIVSTLKLMLEVVKELKDTEAPITAVKFSPDGKVLAACTEAGDKSQVIFYDCLVTTEPGGSFVQKSTFELWDVSAATAKAPVLADEGTEASDPTEGMSKSEKKRYEMEQAQKKELGQVDFDVDAFAKSMEARNADIVPEVTFLPTSPACLDFSEDSSMVQYSTQQGLVYVGVETGEVMEDDAVKEAVPNEGWKGYTCPLGWGVQACYGPRAGLGDVKAVARSEDKALLASVDCWGALTLRCWPAPGKAADALDAAPTKTFRGHSSCLSGVAFSVMDDFVVTTGADDRCAMQWVRVRDDAAEAEKAALAAAGSEDGPKAAPEPPAGYDDVVAALAAEAPAAAAVAPRAAEASFVHGLSTFSGNVAYNADGAAVFAAGSLGVLYQKRQHAQLLFGDHGDAAVRVFAASPSGALVATGDASGAILVWDACTAEPVAGSKPFARCHSAAVTALAFSGDGKSLVSVGGDAQHSVALWTSPRGDWTDPTLVSAQGSGTAPVYCAAWKAAPAPGLKSVAYDFVTGGGAGLSFWSIGGAGNLVPVLGRLGASGAAPDTITCAVAVGSQWVAGGASGTVTVWEGNAVVKVVAAAHGTSGATDAPTPVTDLRVTPGGTGCVSGGADGFVKVWDAVGKDGLAVVSEFDVSAQASPKPIRSAVAAVAVDAAFSKLLVVTQSAELLEIVRDSGSNVQLLCAHAGSGVTAAVKHPDPEQADLFATGGGDGTVRVWSRGGNRAEAVLEAGAAVSALSFSPAGDALVAALSPSGAIIGISVDTSSGAVVLEKNKMFCPSLSPVPSEVQISGDGSTLLVDGKYKTAKGEDEPDPKRGLAWAKPTTDLPVEADAATGCLFVY
jgi:WD40 repeat protein